MKLGWVAVLLLAAAPAMAQEAARAGGAQTEDMATLELGMRVYKDALNQGDGGAGCELCHNWNGWGRQHNMLFAEVVPAGGPALTTSTLTREQMIEVVACGKFDGGFLMPNYRNDAWTAAYKCYGKTAAEDAAGEHIKPPQPGMRTLAQREIEAVVAFIQAVYQGKQMSLDWCLKWFGTNSKGCDNWRP